MASKQRKKTLKFNDRDIINEVKLERSRLIAWNTDPQPQNF